jgi:Leucine-rich repeat (LRR) protein
LSKFPTFPNDLRIKELNISHNKLQNIGFIPSSIRVINISHNQFQQVACIHQYIPSVESIDGSYNKIQSLEEVAQCTKLISLNLEHNKIENEVIAYRFPVIE